MKIGIHVGRSTGRSTGVVNYRNRLLTAISRQETDVTYFDARPTGWQPIGVDQFNEILPDGGNQFEASLRERLRHLPAARWLYRNAQEWSLKRTFSTSGVSLFHAFNFVPLHEPAAPTLPVVYDLSFIRYPDMHPKERLRALETLPQVIAAAPLVHTISEFSKREIVSVFGYPAERIVVAYPAANTIYRPRGPDILRAELDALGLTPDGYLLAVGTIEPRKNLKTLIAAYARTSREQRARYPLIVVGGEGWGGIELPAIADQLKQEGSLRFLGYVPDQVLHGLYEGTRMLFYPSVYEGFGMPVVEAMACGAPVAHSSGTSMDEITGSGARQISALDVDIWTTCIQQAMDTPKDKAVSMQNIADAARFSWTSSAQVVRKAYDAIVGREAANG